MSGHRRSQFWEHQHHGHCPDSGCSSLKHATTHADGTRTLSSVGLQRTSPDSARPLGRTVGEAAQRFSVRASFADSQSSCRQSAFCCYSNERTQSSVRYSSSRNSRKLLGLAGITLSSHNHASKRNLSPCLAGPSAYESLGRRSRLGSLYSRSRPFGGLRICPDC